MSSIRTATILMTDLVGSTAMGARLRPEAAERLREEHFELLRRAVEAHGGRQVKNLGDGVMAAFPSGAAAVRAAVALQESVAGRNRHREPELLIRVGISHGDVNADDGDYFGRCVVEASRLCGAADGGQILVADVIRVLVRDREGLAFERVADLELAGLPEACEAFAVRWEAEESREELFPLPMLLSGGRQLEFVGRAPERRHLLDLLARSADGEAVAAVVTGEPGIGKTRLCSCVGIAAQQAGAAVLMGRCEEGIGLAYRPWIEALTHLVESCSEADLRSHADRYGGELAQLVPTFAARAEMPPVRRSDPETERYLLFGAIAGLLRQVARERQLVLILDDLHWADRSSLLLLRHVVPALAGTRALVLIAGRPAGPGVVTELTETLSDLARHQGLERVDLTGLREEDVVALLEADWGHEIDAGGRALAKEVHRETDGNPFFVVELLRHLRERGTLRRGAAGRWHVTEHPQELGLPPTVRDVVTCRLQRLPPAAAGVLAVGAAIGRDFELELVAGVADLEQETVLELLEASTHAALVTESPERPGCFAFAHAIVGHTVYDRLGATRRARLHRRIAVAMEGMLGAEVEERLPDLARHWIAASGRDARGRAVECSLGAGRRALDDLAPHQAARWFTTALELHRDGADVQDEFVCELLLRLGQAQHQAGEPGYRETLLEAAALAIRQRDDDRLFQAATTNNRGFFSALGQLDGERIDVLEQCLGRLQPQDDHRRAQVLALLTSEQALGPDDGTRRRRAEEAVTLARAGGDARVLVSVLQATHVPIWAPDTLRIRARRAEEGLRVAGRLGDPSARFWATYQQQAARTEAGDLQRSRTALASMRALADEIGDPTMDWMTTYTEAAMETVAGRFGAAEALAERAGRAEEPDAPVIYGSQIATVRWSQGRVEEVIPLLEQGVQLAPRIPAYSAALALAYCETGHPDLAAPIVRELTADDLAALPWDAAWTVGVSLLSLACAEIRDRAAAEVLLRRLRPWKHLWVYNNVVCHGPLSLYTGVLEALLERSDEAQASLSDAVSASERLGAPFLVARAHLGWARLLAAAGDDVASAADHIQRGLEFAQTEGSGWTERQLLGLRELIGC
jgi:class 3 adenylate cyclase/tetratricopeptide (TPR) repeat protein